MSDSGLTITPCRIIPCDIGTDLSESEIDTIRSELDSASSWNLDCKTDSGLAVIEARYDDRVYSDEGCDLSVHIFDDGVCVFCLEDYTERYDDFHDYDPETTLERRFETHDEILSQTHPCSDSISGLIDTLREIVDDEVQRFTALSEWESAGFSYVFSFYFLDIDLEYISEDELQDKLVFLLFSEEAQRGIDQATEADINPEEVKRRYRAQFREILQTDHETLPYLHTCGTWSTVLVIGGISRAIIDDYRRMEINLQRTWFYSYITGQFIERSLNEVSDKTPKAELERLDNALTNMMNQITKYQSINESMLTTRELELYNMLRDTSRLDRQTETIQKQADLARQRYDWLLNEERTQANNRIDFVLFIIAVVTVITEYQTLLNLGIYLLPISMGVFVLSLYFFTPFFRESFR